MSDEEKLFHSIGNSVEGAIKGQLFGKQCYKIGKKAFVCFYENEMVFKLKGEDHLMSSSLEGSQLFDPSKKKRPMKEWVQVPHLHHNHWQKLAESAADYVSNLSK